MDKRLEKALEFSNYMTTLNNERRLLHEKYLENTVHYINGGKFSVTTDLMCFVNLLISSKQQSAILIDDNNTPIKIEDLSLFLTEILDIYFNNTNDYLNKYNQLKTKRSVEDLISL